MASQYQYTTSPRKLEPTYPKKAPKKKNLRVVEEVKRQNIKATKEQKQQRTRITMVIVMIFAVLLVISYRNSQINEKFSQVQNLKKELASVEKENEQLKVSIENSLNINEIEQTAKEKLGMQKLSNKDTIYINLPKKDYTQTPSEKIKIDQKSWFEKLIEDIKGLFSN